MSKRIFEYAVIYKPKKSEKKDGKTTELVIPPTVILAANEKEANFLAARAVPEKYATKLDQLEVAVRPF